MHTHTAVTLVAALGVGILSPLLVDVISSWLENRAATHTLKITIKRRGTGEKETLEIDENASASEIEEEIREQMRPIRDDHPSNGGTPAN